MCFSTPINETHFSLAPAPANSKIYENNNLNSVKVAKAGYADENSLYEVDGISGATITSNGVTTFLLRDLKRYEKYFMRNLNE